MKPAVDVQAREQRLRTLFEGALIESAKHKGDSKKAITLPVSIAIHGLVIGLALGASMWFIEDIPEPPIPVTFYAAAPPRLPRPRPPPSQRHPSRRLPNRSS